MQSPEAGSVPIVHVERTDDPAVMRWVCSSPSLDAVVDGRRRPPWEGEAALSMVAEVVVVAGTIAVRASDANDWPHVVTPVHDALVGALGRREQWLFEPIDVQPAHIGEASVIAVQRIVDAAAGAITGAHGGSITVIGIDDAMVTLRLSGACHGCRFTDDTVRRVVEPAVRRAFPLLHVSVDR